MKTSLGQGYNPIYPQKNISSNKIFKNAEQFKSSNNFQNQIIYQSIFNQNQYNINNKNMNKNKTNNTIPLNKIINIPKYNTNIIPTKYFEPQKNPNPTHMKFNNGTKKNPNNQYSSKSQEKSDLQKSAVYHKNLNKNIHSEYPKKKMGISQVNFYTKNNRDIFPNIQNQNSNNNLKEKENLYSLNSNWQIYSQNNLYQKDIYSDFINNIMRENCIHKIYNDNNYMRIFDFEYKRKEEKLKKGQNQLILERLQKKYETQIKSQNMHRTGTGFYKNNKLNKRQRSAQDNNNIINNNINENKKEIKSEITKKNSFNINNINNNINSKIEIDANNSINNDRKFNKTFNNGFNVKKFNKERKKKEKIIFGKIFKYFKKRNKTNYLWMKYFNKKIKTKELEETENLVMDINFKKYKSFDMGNMGNIYPKLIKKIVKKNIIFKKNKKLIIKKEEIKYNSDNSEFNEIREYKRQQRKLKSKKSEYTHFININNNNKHDKIILESDSNSENSFNKNNEPKFCGIFDKDEKHNTNINYQTKENKEKEKEERRFNFRTTANFFSKNNNNKSNNPKQGENPNEQKTKESDNNKFNIENIINNVIENNKKAAAARSSTSFYNIGSHFMNNRMRSTKTNFFNSRDKKGTYTGTKDSNFTKEQANEGRYYKPNSLKLTLINPLGWRKHEEIWSNLVSIKLGLADLEKYLQPPNDTDVLVSSYLKMNPKVINFCSIQKINTSKTNNENCNFISFMIDDNIQNPKLEIKKWKEAYKRVIFRWHPDKLFATLEEINFKNEQQKNELKKKSTQIINNMNTLYKSIIEILNKIIEAKDKKEEHS